MRDMFNEKLYMECVALHTIATPYVDQISRDLIFPRSQQDLMWRSALRKDHELFGTILHLIDTERSGVVLPLLRPICEDVVYLIYFSKLPPEKANELLGLYSQREVLEGLNAQIGTDEKSLWRNEGFDGPKIKKQLKDVEEKLAGEARLLAWDRKLWPTAKFVAKHVNLESVYERIYFGSSKGVHFSPHHLMRMIWGQPPLGPFSADLKHFEKYYEAYALTNACWLYCFLLAHCGNAYGEDTSEEINKSLEKMLGILGDIGMVPIVTAEELFWRAGPKQPSGGAPT